MSMCDKCRHLSWRGRCKVYAVRPDVCREFDEGCRECLGAREFFNSNKRKG